MQGLYQRAGNTPLDGGTSALFANRVFVWRGPGGGLTLQKIKEKMQRLLEEHWCHERMRGLL